MYICRCGVHLGSPEAWIYYFDTFLFEMNTFTNKDVNIYCQDYICRNIGIIFQILFKNGKWENIESKLRELSFLRTNEQSHEV